MAIELTAPRNIAELSNDQLLFVAELILFGMKENELYSRCFIKFSGIEMVRKLGEKYYFRVIKTNEVFALDEQEVASFSKQFRYLTTDYEHIVPLQKIGGYRACDKYLRDTIFLQYLDAENYYQAYIATSDEKHMDKLLSTLYLSGKKYNNNLNDKRAKYFSRKASDIERYCTLMWFMGVKKHLSKRFKHLFSEGGDGGPVNMYDVIQNQVRLLTAGDITKRNDVLQSNTWTALHEMNEKCREAEELKSKTQ